MPCSTTRGQQSSANGRAPRKQQGELSSHAGALGLQELHGGLLLVARGHCQGRLALGVGLVHVGASLEHVLAELLAAVARRIVETAVAGGVHGEGVRALVQEELHHGDAVGADGVAERGDALQVLGVKGLLLVHVLLDGLEVAHLRRLVDAQGRLLDLLHCGLHLLGKAAHLLADLQHELLVLVVLHRRLEAVLLDVLEDLVQLRVVLQGLQLLLHGCLAALELRVVVLRDGLRLQPAAHGLRVLRKLLEGLGDVGVPREVRPHLLPGPVIDARHASQVHGGAIAELQVLSLSNRHCWRVNTKKACGV
mmetsp:Transcript_14940/g.39715  ORF Transcript_14940/g.39715 Transcript_14940/m.39715 type:complete len:308 (+) Transcript_14940:404-1327(+)